MNEPVDPLLLKLVDEADFATNTPRWVAFARFRLSRFGRDVGPNAKTPHDYVTRAVVEVLDGQHDVGKAKSLFALVCAVIAMRIRIDIERETLTPV